MLSQIENHISLLERSIAWAEAYGKSSFPIIAFKEYRRKLRKVKAVLMENISAAAYGESQVGKSYLMSSLLSSPDSPFVIQHGGRSYSFVDELNSSGGSHSQVESTGVITRFTLAGGRSSVNAQANTSSGIAQNLSQYVRLRLLSVVDVVLLVADAYYNDIKISAESQLRFDVLNQKVAALSSLWAHGSVRQQEIGEDDIKDIADYFKEVLSSKASHVVQSEFCAIVAPQIQYVDVAQWGRLFSLLWNENEHMTRLFETLISAYKQLGFSQQVYVPFDAVLRSKGTLLNVGWLDTVCGASYEVQPGEEATTDVFGAKGEPLATSYNKGLLSSLIAEVCLELPEQLAAERPFLRDMDLLDFPGARSRGAYKEQDIQEMLPHILRRGKVAFLFNKYARTQRISSVLFCHHNNQKSESTLGNSIETWVDENIGHSPEERAKVLEVTEGVAPLFMICTKFNMDLQHVKTDTPECVEELAKHWQRFDKVIPEIIGPSTWFDHWVPQGVGNGKGAFQNVYLLRDFYWSGKSGLFCGYSDGVNPSPETAVGEPKEFPGYLNALRESFLKHDFVRQHFAQPSQAWDDVATLNNDGSKAIISQLNRISGKLQQAREQRILEELKKLKTCMLNTLETYFVPSDEENQNQRVRNITRDIRREFAVTIGAKPELFGRIIDSLMVSAGELRTIAYDVIVMHKETPRDVDNVRFIRVQSGVNLNDSRQRNIERLCEYFAYDDQEELEEFLAKKEITLDMLLNAEDDGMSTLEGVVTKHILLYWIEYLNSQAQQIATLLPHSDDVVYMLITLMQKLGLRKVLQDRIGSYCTTFEESEQCNAISDFAALTLNNFVATVGRDLLPDTAMREVEAKALRCSIKLDADLHHSLSERRAQPLIDALSALDKSSSVLSTAGADSEVLRLLPFWENYKRWQNLLFIGLIFASDVSEVDPKANEAIKEIIEEGSQLY